MIIEHVGLAYCHTPACGHIPGTQTNGLSDVIRVGRLLRLMCQRCGGDWGISENEIHIRLTPTTVRE